MKLAASQERAEVWMKLAEEVAQESPCIRRQYGAVISDDSGYVVQGFNARMSNCCKGKVCIRDRYGTLNGERAELGAEIHAEQAVLIKYDYNSPLPVRFYLAGFAHGEQLLDENVYPCHSCALMIKYAGFRTVVIRSSSGLIVPVSIAQIIESRENAWSGPDLVI